MDAELARLDRVDNLLEQHSIGTNHKTKRGQFCKTKSGNFQLFGIICNGDIYFGDEYGIPIGLLIMPIEVSSELKRTDILSGRVGLRDDGFWELIRLDSIQYSQPEETFH